MGDSVIDCEFCGIVLGVSEARIVYNTEDVLAFFPLKPATVGHTLLITKAHVPDIWELTGEQGRSIMQALLKLSSAIRVAVAPDGLNIINSAGRAASQTVGHIHFHLVPRWKDDDFGDIWPPSHFLPEVVKEDVASAIEKALGQGCVPR